MFYVVIWHRGTHAFAVATANGKEQALDSQSVTVKRDLSLDGRDYAEHLEEHVSVFSKWPHPAYIHSFITQETTRYLFNRSMPCQSYTGWFCHRFISIKLHEAKECAEVVVDDSIDTSKMHFNLLDSQGNHLHD